MFTSVCSSTCCTSVAQGMQPYGAVRLQAPCADAHATAVRSSTRSLFLQLWQVTGCCNNSCSICCKGGLSRCVLIDSSLLLLLALPNCREAANATRFAQLFAFMPEVVVPAMYSQLTTPRVLVMQWIEGERLRSASSQAPGAAGLAGAGSSSSSVLAKADAARVAEDLRLVEIGVRCSLDQMLEDGFYHAGALGL